MYWNRQTKRNFLVLLMVVAVGLMCGSSALGATLIVPSGYSTIQSAIDAAVDGDTIQVAPGTYYENLEWANKCIALVGAKAHDSIFGGEGGLSVVDAAGIGRCLKMTDVPDSVSIDGFTFASRVEGFTFTGGHMQYQEGQIQGLHFYSGGGLYLNNSSPKLEKNTITGNSADDGGGLLLWDSGATLTNNIITANSALNNGGGLFLDYSCPQLMNNTITSNTGGGIYDVFTGLAVCVLPGRTITNCILWGNSKYDLVVVGKSQPFVTYSDIGIGFVAEKGNISADPMFVNPSTGDYHLKAGSPCIDTGGNPWKLPLPETDFDGNPRVGDGNSDGTAIVDMGAFEAIVGLTPPGEDVIVQPKDPATGETPVTLTFDKVTGDGVTTVTSTTPSEGQGPPNGFKFGNPPVIFEIATTAEFSGSIEVCFDYSSASYGNKAELKLFHRTDGGWVDVTTSIDTVSKIICGTVTSLSFFGVFESEFVDPVELLQELAGRVITLNLQQGISNSLDAKLQASMQALDDINENNNVAAINTLQAFINTVKAQRGNKISEADADALIASVQKIIDLLGME